MTPTPARRLPALDWMRGLVMVLMTVDHASDVFNRDVVAADSWFFGAQGQDLAPDGTPWAFLTRWASHLCAPTFVFLAGTALALALARRRERGASELQLDLYLLRRGALLVLCELWMSASFQVPVLQVLSAIGLSMMAMALLRRLPTWALLGLGLGWVALGEWVVGLLGWFQLAWVQPAEHWGSLVPVFQGLGEGSGWREAMGGWAPVLGPFVELREHFPLGHLDLFVWHYPPVPWLAVMLLGWGLGRWLLDQDPEHLERRAVRLLGTLGLAALATFALLRWADGYGNYRLTRTDGHWLRWLQLSKYPPSLAYLACELGLMCVGLAACFRWQAHRRGRVRARGPLLVLGQTALFYYLLHVPLILVLGQGLYGSDFTTPADARPFGVAGAWGGALVVCALLYPACLGWRAWKRRGSRKGGAAPAAPGASASS